MGVSGPDNHRDFDFWNFDDSHPVFGHFENMTPENPNGIHRIGSLTSNISEYEDKLRQLIEGVKEPEKELDKIEERIEINKDANKQIFIDIDRTEELEAIESYNDELLKINRQYGAIYRGDLLDLALGKLYDHQFINIDDMSGPKTPEEVLEHVHKALKNDEERTESSRDSEAIQCTLDSEFMSVEDETISKGIARAIFDPILSVPEREILEEIYFWVYGRHPVLGVMLSDDELLKLSRHYGSVYRGVLLDLALDKLYDRQFINIDDTSGPKTPEKILEHVHEALKTESSRDSEAIQCTLDSEFFSIEDEVISKGIARAISDDILSVPEKKTLEEIYFWVYGRLPVISLPNFLMDRKK